MRRSCKINHCLLLAICIVFCSNLLVQNLPIVSAYTSLPLSETEVVDSLECYDCYSVLEQRDEAGRNGRLLGFACFHYLDADKYPQESNFTEVSKKYKFFTVTSDMKMDDLFCTTMVGQVSMKPFGFLPWSCNLGLCIDMSDTIIGTPGGSNSNFKNLKNGADLHQVLHGTIRMEPPGPKLRNCVGPSVAHILDRMRLMYKTSWTDMINGVTFSRQAFSDGGDGGNEVDGGLGQGPGQQVTDMEICRCKRKAHYCRKKLNKLLLRSRNDDGVPFDEDGGGTAMNFPEYSYLLPCFFTFLIFFLS